MSSTRAEEAAEQWARGLYALRSEPSPQDAYRWGYEQAERDLQHREQEARAEGWLPIESAPRDRSSFLIYCPESGIIYQVYRFGGEERYRMWNSGGRIVYQSPSHWMPLPPAPETK
jgi:hypothetical protein